MDRNVVPIHCRLNWIWLLTIGGVGGGSGQQYIYIEGIALTNKVNTEGLREECYICGKSGHMSRDTKKEEGGKSVQAREDSQIQINLAEGTT